MRTKIRHQVLYAVQGVGYRRHRAHAIHVDQDLVRLPSVQYPHTRHSVFLALEQVIQSGRNHGTGSDDRTHVVSVRIESVNGPESRQVGHCHPRVLHDVCYLCAARMRAHVVIMITAKARIKIYFWVKVADELLVVLTD